jgi:uncharacterized membrane protein YdjX (TVP38/TMEM64 family)
MSKEERQTAQQTKTKLRIAVVCIALVLGACTFFTVSQHKNIQKLLLWINDHPGIGFFIFGATYVWFTVLFLPPAILALAAGAVFGLWMGIILVWCSAVTGETLAFLLGRWAARPRPRAPGPCPSTPPLGESAAATAAPERRARGGGGRLTWGGRCRAPAPGPRPLAPPCLPTPHAPRRFLFRDIISQKAKHYPTWQALEGALKDDGWKLVALLRLAPVLPFTLVNYALGVSALPVSRPGCGPSCGPAAQAGAAAAGAGSACACASSMPGPAAGAGARAARLAPGPRHVGKGADPLPARPLCPPLRSSGTTSGPLPSACSRASSCLCTWARWPRT